MSFRVKRPIKTLRNKPSALRKIRLEQLNFARPRKLLLGGLSSVLTITAIIGTVLTLLGFGAALKLETFGLDATDAYSSPFDFLVLSSQVLVQVFNVLSKISINPAPHHVWYFVVAPTCAFVTLLTPNNRGRNNRGRNTIK